MNQSIQGEGKNAEERAVENERKIVKIVDCLESYKSRDQ